MADFAFVLFRKVKYILEKIIYQNLVLLGFNRWKNFIC